MRRTLRGLIYANLWDEARALLLKGCDEEGNVIDAAIALSKEEINEPGKNDGTALHYACERWAPESLVALLIKRGARLDAQDARGNTALLLAAGRRYKVTKLLLEAGASPTIKSYGNENYSPRDAMDVVLWKGGLASFELLLDYSPQFVSTPPAKGEKPIHDLLFRANDSPRMELLISRGADINYASSTTKNSLLHVAAHHLATAWLESLLAHGADLGLASLKNRDGKTAFDLARRWHNHYHPRLMAKTLKLLGQPS